MRVEGYSVCVWSKGGNESYGNMALAKTGPGYEGV